MASNANRGVPPLGPALIRPTQQQPEPDAEAVAAEQGSDDEPAAGQAAESRTAPARGRRRRADRAHNKTGKRGLYLTDAVWQRLQLEAIRKGTTVSAVAGDLLERNLPRLRIERD